ncbi:MAG: permease [Tissierellia bacterium]|nr:permease [Tissierellia bacterium]
MKLVVKRYKFFLLLVILNIAMLFIYPDIGMKSMKTTLSSIKDVLSIIPPVFILLGLLDVWVERETMIKYMGEESGIIGVLIAFFLGSAAAGPLYAAFPIAGVLLKKGSKLSNVLIFIGAWSTTKIPMFLLEASYLGLKFAIIRLVLSLLGIGAITYIVENVLSQDEKDEIYNKVLVEE